MLKNRKKASEKWKLNFFHSVIIHIKTEVCPTYFVNKWNWGGGGGGGGGGGVGGGGGAAYLPKIDLISILDVLGLHPLMDRPQSTGVFCFKF